MKDDFYRVVRLDILSDAIGYRLFLRLKGSEHPIPDDKYTPVVLIDIGWICAVMHTVP